MAARPPERNPGHGDDQHEPAATPQPAPDGPAPDGPTPDELATQLRAVVTVGIDHATPATLEGLLGLRCVRDRARDTNDTGLAAAARDVLRAALDALGDGNYGSAARLLFGATDDTRGQPARERRRVAAYQIDVLPDWFRRRYEPQILSELAEHILTLEHAGPADTSTEGHGTGTEVVPVGDDTLDRAPVTADRPRSRWRHVLTRVRPRASPDGQAPVVVSGPSRSLTETTQTGQLVRVMTEIRDQHARQQWRLVLVIGAGVVFVRYGLDAIPHYVLVLATLGAIKSATDLGRQWRATRTLVQPQTWPGLVLRVAAVVLAGGFILGQDDNDNGPVPEIEDCVLNPDIPCPTTPRDPHPSPNYVPTTNATVPERAAAPECPPANNQERRIAFNGVPPVCISRDLRYTATIRTNYGHFTVTLNTEAFYTVNNFVYLAQWHYYDGVVLSPWPPAPPDRDPSRIPTELPPILTDIWTHLLSGSPVNPPATTDTSNDRGNTSPDDRGLGNRDTPIDQGDRDAVQVPGYGLIFETHQGAYPDDPLDGTMYLVMVDSYQPDQFAVIVTPEAQAIVADGGGVYPLLGVVLPECLDVFAQRDRREGWDVKPRNEAIVIEGIDITTEPASTPTTRPTTPIPNIDPCGQVAATRDD